MFGGKVRTRLDLTKDSQRGKSNCELPRNSKLLNASKYATFKTNLPNGNLELWRTKTAYYMTLLEWIICNYGGATQSIKEYADLWRELIDTLSIS